MRNRFHRAGHGVAWRTPDRSGIARRNFRSPLEFAFSASLRSCPPFPDCGFRTLVLGSIRAAHAHARRCLHRFARRPTGAGAGREQRNASWQRRASRCRGSCRQRRDELRPVPGGTDGMRGHVRHPLRRRAELRRLRDRLSGGQRLRHRRVQLPSRAFRLRERLHERCGGRTELRRLRDDVSDRTVLRCR